MISKNYFIYINYFILSKFKSFIKIHKNFSFRLIIVHQKICYTMEYTTIICNNYLLINFCNRIIVNSLYLL